MSKLQVINGFFTVDIYRGDTSDIFIDRIREEVNGEDVPVDLTTIYSNMRFQIRRTPTSKKIFSATLGNGIEFTADSDDNPNSAILIKIPDTVSREFITGRLQADLEGTYFDGTVQTITTPEGNQEWKITIKPDRTQ